MFAMSHNRKHLNAKTSKVAKYINEIKTNVVSKRDCKNLIQLFVGRFACDLGLAACVCPKTLYMTLGPKFFRSNKEAMGGGAESITSKVFTSSRPPI